MNLIVFVMVQARCLDQKRDWCQELKRLILESYTADKAIPKNVIELVMQLTSKDEQDLSESPTSASAQTRKPCPKPQYLEKKKRRKSVTAVLSGWLKQLCFSLPYLYSMQCVLLFDGENGSSDVVWNITLLTSKWHQHETCVSHFLIGQIK